jgi:hypothetical protein
MDTDRNLLFGVLALQGELIDPAPFVEGCTAWATRKDRALADLLAERGWITNDDRRLINELLERRLSRHAGDARHVLEATAAGSAGLLRSVRDIEKAEALYTGIPPKEPEDVYFKACLKAMRSSLIGTGQAGESLTDEQRAARQQAADEAMKLLREAVAAGYTNPDRYANDPTLASLRTRPDFQTMLQSLRRGS